MSRDPHDSLPDDPSSGPRMLGTVLLLALVFYAGVGVAAWWLI